MAHTHENARASDVRPSDDRDASGWLVAWGCGAIPLTYVVAYVVVRLSHVLVNHGYRIHSASGLTWWDVVFAPMVMLEQAVRGIG